MCEGAIIFRIAMAASKDVDKLQALNYICTCILEDDVDKGWGSTLKDWLQSYAWNRIILWKDQDGKGIDVGIDLRNEMCPWYKYSRAQNCRKQCRLWHICKRFLEGDCNGECGRSHDFFDEGNRENTEKLGLDRFSNERIRRIVGYSFPQVCLLYVKGTCPSTDCPHLHICPSVVQQTSCDCPLVHNNDDMNKHNKTILERYGLITKFSTRIDYLTPFHILVPVEQRSFEWNKYSFQAGPNEMPLANKSLFSSNCQDSQEKTKLKINLPSTSSDSRSSEANENVNAVLSRPSSCCIDKEKVAIERNQRKEKMPHQSEDSNLTSQVSKSTKPSERGNAPGLFSRHIDKERTDVVERKEERTEIARLSNAEGRSTTQESKCSPGLPGVACDIPFHFKSLSLDKGKGAVEEHHGNEKLPPSSSDPETISGLTLSVTADVFEQALEEPKKRHEMTEYRTKSVLVVATQDLPASKAKGSLTSKDSESSAEFHGLMSGSATKAAPEGIEKGRGQAVASLIKHFESTAETCRVKDDLRNLSNSHAVTKGRETAERHHERPPRTSEERFKILHDCNSLPKTLGVSDVAPRQPSPHYLYKGIKEAFHEDQTIDKVSSSSSYRSLTSQVSKSITGNASESEDIHSYPSPNRMKKEEASEVHREKQKIPAGSSDLSFTSHKSKSVPGTANASDDRHSYPSNPPFIDNGQGTDKGKKKEGKTLARSLGSSSTTQENSANDKGIVSRKQEEEKTHQTVPGNKSSSVISKSRTFKVKPNVSDDVPSFPNSPSIYEWKKAGVGNKENQKITLTSSDSTLTSQDSVDISDTKDGPNVLNTHSDDKGNENAENEKEREKMPSSYAGRKGRVMSQESSSISEKPYPEGQMIFGRKDDLQTLHSTGKIREAVKGPQKEEKMPPSRSAERGFITVPRTQESKSRRVRRRVKHSDASKLHPIDDGKEGFEGNRKSATDNVRNKTNDVPSHPDLSSSVQKGKDLPQGCQKEKLPLRDSEGKDTQQHER